MDKIYFQKKTLFFTKEEINNTIENKFQVMLFKDKQKFKKELKKQRS